MDFVMFFEDVKQWVVTCNQKAVELNMRSVNFWDWVFVSAGVLCNKYNNEQFAKNQMTMLVNWLITQVEGV